RNVAVPRKHPTARAFSRPACHVAPERSSRFARLTRLQASRLPSVGSRRRFSIIHHCPLSAWAMSSQGIAADKEPAFAERVRTAVFWRWGSQVAAQVITWSTTIIVVRLLDPRDY